MAFDSTDYAKPALETDDVGQLILKARELLSNPARWHQGSFTGDNGSMCVLRAVEAHVDVPNPIVVDRLNAAVPPGFRAFYRSVRFVSRVAHFAAYREWVGRQDDPMNIVSFYNDFRLTSHADILALLTRAASLPRAGGE